MGNDGNLTNTPVDRPLYLMEAIINASHSNETFPAMQAHTAADLPL